MRIVYAVVLTATATAVGCAGDDEPDTSTLGPGTAAATGASGTSSGVAPTAGTTNSAPPTQVATGLPGTGSPSSSMTAPGSSTVPAPTLSASSEPTSSPASSTTETDATPSMLPDAPDVAPAASESGAGGSDDASDAGSEGDGTGGIDNAPEMPDPELDDSASEVDAGGEQSGGGCPHSGNVTYHLNGSESWPSDVVEKLTAALDEGTWYYNCYSDLEKSITINYKPGVPTAEGNVDGVISFGDDRGYMQTATTMHEIAHTMGVAYYPWTELIADGRWTGAAVKAVIENLPAEERDPDMYSQRTYITCDTQHFWPYGLQTASEHQSEWSLINNVRIVAAMNVDKQNYIDTH